ncbi:MAG TPA: hypothetical protein VK158_06970, partial [Acidobacteriota bacterium]|nr:hypothetical protein [Acidobacteriota bacterium]
GHGSVRFYFKEFNDKNWFEKADIRKNKGRRGYSTRERCRLNSDVYFQVRKFNTDVKGEKQARQRFKEFMCEFLNHEAMRKYVANEIPMKLFDFFDQIMLYLIIFDSSSLINSIARNPTTKGMKSGKVSDYFPKGDKIKKEFSIDELKQKIFDKNLPISFDLYLAVCARYLRDHQDYDRFLSFMGELSEPVKRAQSLQIL